MIGKVITKHNLERKKLQLLTKCYGTVGETPAAMHIRHPIMKTTKDYINQGGLSRAAIFNAVDASLVRLQTSYIDLLQIHRFDYETPIEETMKALHDLVSSGKVRYIGKFDLLTTGHKTCHRGPVTNQS
jgi:aryl-alcohol dehydrogenase-like predicted oxidoreductase